MKQDFRNTKIHIKSEEHSKAFQEAVFEAGGGWLTGGKVILPDAVHIYVDENLILTAASNLRYFESHDYREIVFPSPTKGHPHALLMMQYAEDAKTTDKPWELDQIKTVQNIWKDIGGQFIFNSDHTYRRKPKTKLINGVEIPDISFTPEYLQDYWFPDPSTDGFCHQTLYAPMSSGDIHRVKHGLCYPLTEEGKQAAILHSKAMLCIA